MFLRGTIRQIDSRDRADPVERLIWNVLTGIPFGITVTFDTPIELRRYSARSRPTLTTVSARRQHGARHGREQRRQLVHVGIAVHGDDERAPDQRAHQERADPERQREVQMHEVRLEREAPQHRQHADDVEPGDNELLRERHGPDAHRVVFPDFRRGVPEVVHGEELVLLPEAGVGKPPGQDLIGETR